jgi:DNA-binding transcriptional regulator YiaG
VHGRHEFNSKDKEDGKMAYKNESMINTIELGRAIKRRREELKLSLRDVADVTQVSASTLSRIETEPETRCRQHRAFDELARYAG